LKEIKTAIPDSSTEHGELQGMTAFEVKIVLDAYMVQSSKKRLQQRFKTKK
jgi:hypothetical protein